MSGFIDRLKRAMLPPILLIGGVVVIYFGVDEMRTSQAIADHGKTAVADVVSVEWKEKGVSKREKGFHANIHYQTEDQHDVTTKISVSNELGKQLRDDQGQPQLPIKYLPENPDKVVLADHRDNSSFMFGAGAVMIVVGAGIFIYRRRQARAALASGGFA